MARQVLLALSAVCLFGLLVRADAESASSSNSGSSSASNSKGSDSNSLSASKRQKAEDKDQEPPRFDYDDDVVYIVDEADSSSGTDDLVEPASGSHSRSRHHHREGHHHRRPHGHHREPASGSHSESHSHSHGPHHHRRGWFHCPHFRRHGLVAFHLLGAVLLAACVIHLIRRRRQMRQQQGRQVIYVTLPTTELADVAIPTGEPVKTVETV